MDERGLAQHAAQPRASDHVFGTGPIGLCLAESPHGPIVQSVASGGAADRAGITIGSRLVAVSGHSIAGIGQPDVVHLISQTPRPMALRFVSAHQPVQPPAPSRVPAAAAVAAVPAAASVHQPARAHSTPASSRSSAEFNFGAPEGSLGMGLHQAVNGDVRVAKVRPGSLAARLGVPEGGVLQAVNGASVVGMSKAKVGEVIVNASQPLLISVALPAAAPATPANGATPSMATTARPSSPLLLSARLSGGTHFHHTAAHVLALPHVNMCGSGAAALAASLRPPAPGLLQQPVVGTPYDAWQQKSSWQPQPQLSPTHGASMGVSPAQHARVAAVPWWGAASEAGGADLTLTSTLSRALSECVVGMRGALDACIDSTPTPEAAHAHRTVPQPAPQPASQPASQPAPRPLSQPAPRSLLQLSRQPASDGSGAAPLASASAVTTPAGAASVASPPAGVSYAAAPTPLTPCSATTAGSARARQLHGHCDSLASHAAQAVESARTALAHTGRAYESALRGATTGSTTASTPPSSTATPATTPPRSTPPVSLHPGVSLSSSLAADLRLSIPAATAAAAAAGGGWSAPQRRAQPSARHTMRGARGEPVPPAIVPPLHGLQRAAVSARARRSANDSPLNSSARRRVEGGAYWLGMCKLRHVPTPRDAAAASARAQRDAYKFRPIRAQSARAPRQGMGSAPQGLAAQNAGGGGGDDDDDDDVEVASPDLRPHDLIPFYSARQTPAASDPMVLMRVKRGEASDFVQRL